jgi:hypothetical protein
VALTLVPITGAELEDLTKRGGTRTPFDLTEYIGYVQPLPVDSWNKATLDNGDKPRVVKQRLNMAAREIGKDLVFKKDKADENGAVTITFRVEEWTPAKVAAAKERADKVRATRSANQAKPKAGKQLAAV